MHVLEDKICSVKASTEQINCAFEEKTNQFLDGVNQLKNDILQLTKEFNELNEDLLIYTNENKNETLENIERMENLLSDANKFIAGIKQGSMYSILKNEINDLLIESRQLKEIIQDIKMKYINFPENKELQDVLKRINAQF